MGKTFNELFDEFFNRSSIKNINDQISGIINDMREDTKRISDIIANLKDMSSMDEIIEEQLDKSLGKPDKTEFYSENGLFYEKRIWHTPNGDMVKLIVSDDPSLLTPPQESKSLETKLEEALETEDYEKAALIRDEIKKNKK